jgi:predicted acylesterase/phospholipase RssA
MEDNKDKKEKNTVKAIVISGGGPAGFSFYGAIKECQQRGLWNFENLKSMYGASIGSILCVIICMNYDWQVLDDFLIKRPWKNVFKFNMYTILDSFQKRGIYDISVIKESFLPLFNGKDISIDVTLQEFYEANGIDLHIFATEVHTYELIDFSHKTHPDWRLVDAVYCSCSLPIVFSPMLLNGSCYCDGGFISNYPVRFALKDGYKSHEVLGVRMTVDRINQARVTEESTIFDYIICLFNKLLEKRLLAADAANSGIQHEISVESPQISIYNAYQIISSADERARLIDYGKDCVKTLI